MTISLEAEEAVDDIVCCLGDGTRWFIQSKRTAGNDAALRAAAGQWARQELTDGDRVVLASRDLRGILKGLQPQIAKVIRHDPISTSAQTAVSTFRAVLTAAGADDAGQLLEQVQFIEWRLEELGDADLEAGIAMLAGTIVPGDQAQQAFEVLRNRMQLAASRRETTSAREWIESLVHAGLDVFADGHGPTGARERARQLALCRYEAMLAGRKNHLDLSALVTDVPEIVVDDALEGWEVSWETNHRGALSSTDVLNVVRATPRFVVAGLPGMGKSELTRQIAAWLASENHAPLPIHVDLRHITAEVHSSADITLDLLLGRPSRSVTGQDPDVLLSALTMAVLEGEAILLIDGLDEAQRAQGQVAAGLTRLLSEIPPETGLLLTTRDSALSAARMLKVPHVQLETPGNLREAMVQLIAALAPSQGSAADHSEWTAEKGEELATAFRTHEDVWKVPLLATLATVRLTSGRGTTGSVSVLLNQVIEDSVTEWELRRKAGRDNLHPGLDPQMLLDGFAAIGHLLIGAASISAPEAMQAVRASLKDWRLAPSLEQKMAEQVVTFWDERVGVFVDDGDGIVPRSRQFAELAEVRWLTGKDVDDRRAWLQRAVEDDRFQNAVSLASAIDPVIRSALLELSSRQNGSTARDRAATWLSRQWKAWPEDSHQRLQVIDVLADAAEDQLPNAVDADGIFRTLEVNRQRADGAGWHFVLSLVNAERNPLTDSHRQERIARFDLSPARRSLLTALTGLIDAEEHERPLDEETLTAVEEIIKTPRPAKPESTYNEEGVWVFERSASFVTGVGDIVERSTQFLDQLGPDAPETLYRMGKKQSVTQFKRISRRLRALGHEDPEPLGSNIEFPAEWLELPTDHHGLGWLLRDVEQFAPAAENEDHKSWRYPELGRLLDALGYAETTFAGFARATKEDDGVVRAWLSAHIEAFSLDGNLLALEARQLLNAQDAEAAACSLIYGRRQPEEVPTVISETTALALVSAFESDSEWIVASSFRLLTDTCYPSVAEALSEPSGDTTWRTLYKRCIAILLNSADRDAALTVLSKSENTASRAAAASILRAENAPRSDLFDQLRVDDDGQVRYCAGGDPRAADAWTCRSCGSVNTSERKSCSHCHVTASWP